MPTIRDYLTSMKETFDLKKKTIEQIREDWVAMTAQANLPEGTMIDKTIVDSLSAEWVKAINVPAGKEQTILYFHGGGFYSGSAVTHRGLAARISAASGVRVLVVEYRLAPENKFPAANDDCLLAYRWLIRNGISSKNIILGGDSAGGGLVIMTLLSLRDACDPLPKAAFMLSPIGDLINFDGESYESRAEVDPMLSRNLCQLSANYYFDSSAIKPPILSPINENLSGLPSLLIQVGDHEVLLSDSIRLAERAKEANVDVKLEIWDEMWHLFHSFGAIVPEARQAIDNIGKFIKQHIG